MRAKASPTFSSIIIASILIIICTLLAGCQSQAGPEIPVLEGTGSGSGELTAGEPVSLEPEYFSPGIPPENIKFGRISVDQGLSQSSVQSIFQDSIGLMWFGTEDGLNQFNGYEFSIFKHDPENANSLSSNNILAIYEDSRNQLWFGTEAGVDRYERTTNEWQHYPLDHVQAIIEDRSGELWVGSLAGLFKFQEGEKPGLVRYMSESTFALLEDAQGFLWAGTDRGLIKLDQDREKIAHYQHASKNENTLVENFVNTMIEDARGNLWIGTNGGLDRFDSTAETFTHFISDAEDPGSISNNVIRVIYEDRSGTLWVGTDEGLNCYDANSKSFLHYVNDIDDASSLSSNLVRTIFQDRGGVIWIGTSAGGLSTYDVTDKNFAHYDYDPGDKNSLGSNLVFAVFEDDAEILWVGTGGGGIDRLSRNLDIYTHYQHDPDDPTSLSDNFVTAILVDRQGVLWAGTANGGLNVQNRYTGEFEHYRHDKADFGSLAHDSISAIMKDRLGVIWIGTQGGGLDSFDQGAQQFEHHYGLSSKIVNTIFEDQEGVIWVGTSNGGLNKYDRVRKKYTHYIHDPYDPESISSNNVLAIYQDQQGVIWIGTMGGGLNKFNPESEKFRDYREKDGLPNDVVYGILEDEDGLLWLSTNNGLSKFDPRSEHFRNFDVLDGLQSNEFNRNAYFKNRRGEMFFGGVNGLNSFFPEDITDDPYQPPVVLTSLTQAGGDAIPGSAVETTQEAIFYWPNNFFEFEFAGLSYSQPEKNQYAYLLEGFRDEQWNYIGTKRFGRYTNLPGGNYTLWIKAANKDGIWNEPGTAIQITIVPPIWMTWWFQAGTGLLVVGLVFGWYQLRMRNIRSRTEELEDQVNDRTKELAALNTIAVAVSSSLDLQRILDDALGEILETMQMDAGGIYLLEEYDQNLTIEASQGLSEEFIAEINNLQVGEGFSGNVIQNGEILVIPDVSADPHLTRSIVKDEGFHALVVLPLISRGKVLGTMFLMTHQYRTFVDKDVELLTAIGSQIGGAVENAKFFEHEHHRSEQFRVLAEVGRRISTILDVDEVLEEVVRLIRETFGYYHVAIGLVEGEDVVYRVGSGELWDNRQFHFTPSRLKIGQEGLSGWVAATGTPLVVPDVSKEPRYVWMRGSQTRSEVTVPILVKGQVIGVLDTQSDKVNDFDDTDLAVLQSLAHQVGAAIENARLYAQAQQAAVLEERGRLARELHDAVTQTLFSASLLAEALPASWENDPQEGEKLLEELKQLNRGALAEMRTLLIELRPSALVEANFGDLLHQLAEAASGREGLPIEVKVECECVLPPDVHIALYRIAQEAVNNVVKHARANQVSIHVSCSHCAAKKFGEEKPKEIILEIRDDGKGFEQGPLQHDHLGLGIMQERAQDIGARLQVKSEPGAGTHILVSWQAPDRAA
ncbi:MAG: two-component regulator propeller domain-containing protein [Anaerolineales bacterium]